MVYGRVRLGIRENFFPERGTKHLKKLPRAVSRCPEHRSCMGSENPKIRPLVMWFSGGFGSPGVEVGLDELECLFQPD